MPKYSQASLDRLATCHFSLQVLFEQIIKDFDCTILCGHRTKGEQNLAFNQGRSRCRWPESKHNEFYSLAIDAAPYYAKTPHVRWDKNSLYRWYFFGGFVVATAKRLAVPVRWGGDWDGDTYVKDQRFNDLPHFELVTKK